MIQEYSQRLQLDVCQIYDYVAQKQYQDKNEELNIQIGLAAVRILGALGMAFGALVGVSALTMIGSNPVGAVLVMALGVGIFALNQDLFIISKNATEQGRSGKKIVVEASRSAFKWASDMWNGKTSVADAAPQTVTSGTNFRPLWDKVIAESWNFAQRGYRG